MKSLLDSGKFVGPGASVKQVGRQCDMPFPMKVSDLLNKAECPFSRCDRIHIKVLTNPNLSGGITLMLSNMRRVYATADIGIEVVSREVLAGPQFATLNSLDVGGCTTGAVSPEQTQLSANRNGVGDNELVAYFVSNVVKTIPPGTQQLNGCASVSLGMVAVAQIASQWTLAHEIGHTLDLQHITGENAPACTTQDPTRLMTGCSTSNITGFPTVVQSEIDTMRASKFTRASQREVS